MAVISTIVHQVKVVIYSFIDALSSFIGKATQNFIPEGKSIAFYRLLCFLVILNIEHASAEASDNFLSSSHNSPWRCYVMALDITG